MIPDRKTAGMIGLCAKAGKVQSGGYAAEKSIKSKKAKFCIMAADASEESGKAVKKLCEAYNVDFLISEFDKDTLGHMIGKGPRTSITIEDAGFAENVKKLIGGGKASDRNK